ncbi:hypothetical protein XELAEV_18021548mg [Xenopus laevis]|uniref:Uncharacterized protein n=1 Tax=Xenopus laevis TaxID=8355 RepID=A0A974HRP6_XENLA|nr:hypothetical protein XELAEV_18021548mg [Xenopus laevis]
MATLFKADPINLGRTRTKCSSCIGLNPEAFAKSADLKDSSVKLHEVSSLSSEVIIPRDGDLVVVLIGDDFVVEEGTLSFSFSFVEGMFLITFDNDEEKPPWAFLLFGNSEAVFPACFGLWKVTLPDDFCIDKLCFSTAFCFGETLLPPPFFFSVAESSISVTMGFCVLTFPTHFILGTEVPDLIFGTEYSVDP